jgi:hypothetical protein
VVIGRAGPTLDLALRIDRTAPLTTATLPEDWRQGSVEVELEALDNLAGIAQTYYALDGAPARTGSLVAIDGEGSHTLTFWSVDRAGNAESPVSTVVRIDRTAPTIEAQADRAPNAASRYAAPVTVGFTCADQLSGVAR